MRSPAPLPIARWTLPVLALLGALALPAAAAAAPTLFKVSAYGVQRSVSTSSTSWEDGCRGEHAQTRTAIVARFTTPRATRLRLVRHGGVAVLQPATTRPWRITGTVRASQTATGQRASCAAVNPDGSTRWVAFDASPEDCLSGKLEGHLADVGLERGALVWTPGTDLLAPLVPERRRCGERTAATFRLLRALARVPVRRIVAADGEPIVLRHRDERGSATDVTTTESRERATVYVTFTPIR